MSTTVVKNWDCMDCLLEPCNHALMGAIELSLQICIQSSILKFVVCVQYMLICWENLCYPHAICHRNKFVWRKTKQSCALWTITRIIHGFNFVCYVIKMIVAPDLVALIANEMLCCWNEIRAEYFCKMKQCCFLQSFLSILFNLWSSRSVWHFQTFVY